MKKLPWMRGALALALMVGASSALGADHLDGPAVTADPSSVITDLVSWVDGNNVVLGCYGAPRASAIAKFSDRSCHCCEGWKCGMT